MTKVRNPTVVHFCSYLLKKRGTEIRDSLEPEVLAQVLDFLEKSFKGERKDQNNVRIKFDNDEVRISVIWGEDYCVFRIMITPTDDLYTTELAENIVRYSKIHEELLEKLPKEKLSHYRITILGGISEEESPALLSGIQSIYAQQEITSGSILSQKVLITETDLGTKECFGKDFTMLLLSLAPQDEKKVVRSLLSELSYLSVYEGKLDRFYKNYRELHPNLRDIENNAENIVEDIAKRISNEKNKTAIGKMTVGDAEMLLNKISPLFLDLSSLSSASTIDLTNAMVNYRNAKYIYDRWDEQNFDVEHQKISLRANALSTKVVEAYEGMNNQIHCVRDRLKDALDVVYADLNILSHKADRRLNLLVGLFAAAQFAQLFLILAEYYYGSGRVAEVFLWTIIPLSIMFILIFGILLKVGRRHITPKKQLR